jgi:transcriptional regulator with XRE-family HTH domain
VETFGSRLRAHRHHRGWSLADLAARVHYSAGHLSKVEGGLRHSTRALAAACDAALDAGGALIAAQAPPPPAESLCRSLLDEPPPLAAIPCDPPTAALTGPLGGADDVVDAFTHVLGGLRTALQSTGPGAVTGTAVAQLRALDAMAANTDRRSARTLLTLAGRYAEFLAWLSHEADDEGSALRWIRVTTAYARHLDSPEMEAGALMRRSLLALYCDDGAAVVQLATAAAVVDPTPASRLRATLRLAQGHALTGYDHGCRQALEAAAELAASAGDPRPEAKPTRYGSTHVTDPVGMTEGWCLHELGHSAQALDLLRAAVAPVPGHAHRARARLEVRIALAAVGANDLDLACATVRDVLAAAGPIDSATIRSDLRRGVRVLSRHRRHRPVAELLPELTRLSTRREPV